MEDGGSPRAAYIDEEDCLGFKIWVAELELIVAGSKGKKKPDAAQVFTLLQKLVVTLDRTERDEVREYQRRCEAALIDVLLKGAPPPVSDVMLCGERVHSSPPPQPSSLFPFNPQVRRLIGEALGTCYAIGDQLPLFSRVSALQLFLGTREAFSKETSEDVRLGAMELTTALYYRHGSSLSIGVLETAGLAARYCVKGSSDKTRKAALRLFSAAIEGVGPDHRHAIDVQNEAIKTIEKIGREKDVAEIVKQGVADVLRAVAAAGGARFWSDRGPNAQIAKAACLQGVYDPLLSVRTAYATALAHLIRFAGPAEVNDSLVLPYAEAVAKSDVDVITALALCWVRYLRLGPLMNETTTEDGNSTFIESHALLPLDALALGCPSSGSGVWAGLENDLGAGIMEGDRPHAEACTLHILRAGVIDTLGEGGQRALLSRLAERLSIKGTSPPPGPVLCVGFRAAAMTMDVLGGVDAGVAGSIERAIATGLTSLLTPVRRACALTLASLAKARPSSAARLLGSALSGLKSAADALLEATRSGFGSSSKVSTGVPRGPAPVAARLRSEMNALHGWAVASGALVAAVPDLPLGVPSHYLSVAVQLGSALVEAPRTLVLPATTVEREAGYILLTASCQAIARVSNRFSIFPSSVRVNIAVSAALVFPASPPAQQSTRGDAEALLSCDLWWRAAGVDTIVAAIQGGVVDASKPVAFLIPLLTSIAQNGDIKTHSRSNSNPNTDTETSADTNADTTANGNEEEVGGSQALSKFESSLYRTLACPQDSRPQLAGAAATFVAALLRLCNLPPVFSCLEASHEAMKAIAMLCTRSIMALPFSSPFQPSISIFTPALRAAMPEDDAGLWDADGSTSAETELLRCTAMQQSSLSSSLYEIQARLLGRVLQTTHPFCRSLRCTIIKELSSLCTNLPASSSHKHDTKRVTACLAAAPPLLFAFGSGNSFIGFANQHTHRVDDVDTGKEGEGNESKDVMDILLSLAEVTMTEAASVAGTQRPTKFPPRLLRMVAAELFASVTRVQDHQGRVPVLINALCKRAAETPSLTVREILSLAIGAAARSGGPLALSGSTPRKMIDTLIALTAASDPSLAPSTLHALRTCAASAGPAFAPHVPSTLSLTTRMLLHQEIYSVPGLLPALGRLANAIVAALGPDYVLGSPAYETCRSVVAELRAPGNPDALPSSLEVVLYAQMMALFAPKALPTATHVSVLIATLPSKQPKIRKAVADTLRHVAEREINTVLALGLKVRAALFEALNEETDDATASQLRAVLTTLLDGGALREPGEWISMCGDIVTAKDPNAALSAAASGGMNGDESFEQHDYTHPKHQQQQQQQQPPPPPFPSEQSTAMGMGMATQPRARTRIFAANCLLSIANNDKIPTSKLAAHASDLVDLGFKMATAEGGGSSLRPHGVRLLSALLSSLGDVPDPFSPNPHSNDGLLAQYRAQYGATLRSSLSSRHGSSSKSPKSGTGVVGMTDLGESAGPEVAAAATALAAGVIEKGLVGKDDDAGVLERLMALMCSPLSLKEYDGESQYAEWVGAGTRIAVLEFHARCAVLNAGEKAAATVWRAQGPFLTVLVDRWIGLLHDGIALDAVMHKACSKENGTSHATVPPYRMALYGSTPLSKSTPKSPSPLLVDLAACEGVIVPLRRAWPVALDAATAVLLRDRTVSHGASGKERHATLMDMAIVEVSKWSLNHDGNLNSRSSINDGRLLKALHSMSRCLSPRFLKAGLVDGGVLATNHVPLIASTVENCSFHVACKVASILEQVSGCLEDVPGGGGAVKALTNAALLCLGLRDVPHDEASLIEAATSIIGPSLATLTNCLTFLLSREIDVADHEIQSQIIMLMQTALAAGLEVLAMDSAPVAKSMDCNLANALEVASKHVVQTAVETVAIVRPGSHMFREIDSILADAVERAAAQTAAALVNGRRHDLAAPNLACVLGIGGIVGDAGIEAKCAALVAHAVESVETLEERSISIFGVIAEFFKRAPPPLWSRRIAVAVIRPVMTLLHRVAVEEWGQEDHVTSTASNRLESLTDLAVQACCAHGELGKASTPALVGILIGLGDRYPAAVVSAMGTLGTDPASSLAFRETVSVLPSTSKSKLQAILLSVGTGRLDSSASRRAEGQGDETSKKLPALSLARFAS
jgi:hypothetical protein